MALINCPECKKKISDKCGKCPKCGYPIEMPEALIESLDNEVIEKETSTKKSGKLKKEQKPINRKKLVGLISAIVVLLAVGIIIGYNALLPRINATKAFKKAVEFVEEKNSELEAEIIQSEKLIAKKQPLLDETLVSTLENSITNAKMVKITDFETPSKIEDIISRTEELEKTDYSEVITDLNNKHTALEINAKRYQLVNVPTEAYVIQCLKTIPEITGISAVTEDNDPNGNLNKPGGYTSTVYFSHQKIKLDKFIYGDTLIDQGTDAGGAIEVYTCVEDAVKRRDYLANFDGTITASGTHTVIGTVLVRTSNELTASQQKDFEAKLIDALTYLPEVDDVKESEKGNGKSKNTESTILKQSSTKPKNTKAKDDTSIIQHSNSEQTSSKPSASTININKDIDINQEAINTAEKIADTYCTVSRVMVKEILVDEYGFTEDQASYAIENAQIDWLSYVVPHIEEYVLINEEYWVTREDIEQYLTVEKGYLDSEIKYAFENANIRVNENGFYYYQQ